MESWEEQRSVPLIKVVLCQYQLTCYKIDHSHSSAAWLWSSQPFHLHNNFNECWLSKLLHYDVTVGWSWGWGPPSSFELLIGSQELERVLDVVQQGRWSISCLGWRFYSNYWKTGNFEMDQIVIHNACHRFIRNPKSRFPDWNIEIEIRIWKFKA